MPAARRRGAGTALVAAALAEAARAGARRRAPRSARLERRGDRTLRATRLRRGRSPAALLRRDGGRRADESRARRGSVLKESAQVALPLRVDAEVRENRAEGGSNFRLRLAVAGWPGADPGRFVMLSPGARGAAPRFDPLLPRPMAVYRTLGAAAPPEIEVLYKVTGRGTRLLAETHAGDRVRVVGPLGVPFAMPVAGRRALLVGGGTGIASLYELAARAAAARSRRRDAGRAQRSGADGMRRLRGARRRASHRNRGRQPRSPRPRDRAARSCARRRRGRRGDLRLRPDADDAARRRDRGRCAGAPVRCHSRIAWRAASASASAAQCRAPTEASHWCVATGRSSRRGRSLGGPAVSAVDTRVQLGGIALRNPVLTASGTFGYGAEFAPFFDLTRIGGIVAKSLTLEPRQGNRPPRIAETPAGMLNAIGLENVGVDAFIAEKLPALAAGVVVVASVFETEIERYAEVCKRLSGVPRVAGLEVNASCPHVKSGGIEFGQRAEVLAQLVRATRRATLCAAAREAVAQRHRHPRDGARLRGRGRRRAFAGQHAPGARRRHRDATAGAAQRAWADFRVPPSGRSRCAWSGRRRRPCASRSAGSAGS